MDISPLAQATELTELNISFNHVSDISALENPSGLVMLDLVQNEVTDLTPLVDSGAMFERLDVRSNPIDCTVQRRNLLMLDERTVWLTSDCTL